MSNKSAGARQREINHAGARHSLSILCFLALTAAFSGFFWTLMIVSGHVGANAAQVIDGKTVRLSIDLVSPFMVYDRVPWYTSTAWLKPAVIGLWLSIILMLRFTPLGAWVYLLQIATIILLPVLCIVSRWFLSSGFKARRGASSAVWRTAIVLASICLWWLAITFNLTHLGLAY